MSGYYPQHNDLPQSYEPVVSLPSQETERSRSLRTTVGISCPGIASTLLLLGLVTSPAGNHTPQYGSLAANLLMFMRTITALRIRPVPALPAARF